MKRGWELPWTSRRGCRKSGGGAGSGRIPRSGSGRAGQRRPGSVGARGGVPAADYYDYRAKYEDDRTQLIVPASVRPETAERLKAMGRAAFQAIDGSGLARVDFFVSPDETVIYLNEINTMPGFTRMSMYPRVWQSSGLSYGQLPSGSSHWRRSATPRKSR